MQPNADKPIPAEDVSADTAVAPFCPVDRLPRRRRNKICVVIITVGLLNFIAYTIGYAVLGGDAHNGYRILVPQPDGPPRVAYVVRGHHVRYPQGLESEVGRGAWIYSYLHSITVPLTSGALIISMLMLARPHILATMRDGWVSGRTLIAAIGVVVVLLSLAVSGLFVSHFVAQLSSG